jgi:hypothetical protein
MVTPFWILSTRQKLPHTTVNIPTMLHEVWWKKYSSYYYYSYSSLSPFFLWHMNLSTADLRNYWTEFHETWWSYRYMFLVGHFENGRHLENF